MRRYGDGVLRILEFLAEATTAEFDEGMRWYDRAHRYCAKVGAATGVRAHNVAAAVARLSPQVQWDDNRAAALEVCAGERGAGCARCYGNNVELAELIVTDNTAAGIAAHVLPAPRKPRSKIASFYRNITNPSSNNGTVTVDVWAYRAWLGNLELHGPTAWVSPAQYERIRRDYVAAARLVGMRPHELQAVTWLAARRIAGERGQPELFAEAVGDVGLLRIKKP